MNFISNSEIQKLKAENEALEHGIEDTQQVIEVRAKQFQLLMFAIYELRRNIDLDRECRRIEDDDDTFVVVGTKHALELADEGPVAKKQKTSQPSLVKPEPMETS